MKISFETFRKRSIEKFKENAFKYYKDSYKNLNVNTTLRCLEHGLKFNIKPVNHLVSKDGGCPNCIKNSKIKLAKTLTSNVELFIKKARVIHKDEYNYGNFEYTLAKNVSYITCKVHGDFLCSPNNHLEGRGCKKCSLIKRGLKNRYNKSLVFKEKSLLKHNSFYSYESFIYETAKKKSYVTCKIHGDFLCSPDNHLRGKGCPSCSREIPRFITKDSFRASCIKNKEGFGELYILEFFNKKTCQRFIKIGITSKSVRTRYSGQSYIDYSYKVLYNFIGEANLIFDLEQKIHRNYQHYIAKVDKTFPGYSECYVINMSLNCIVKMIEENLF